MEAKRRIHRFNFDQPLMKSGTKTHVALVDKAANLTEALIIKSYATVTHSIEAESYDSEEGVSEFSRDTITTSSYDDSPDRIFVKTTSYKVTDKVLKIIP